MSLHAYSCHCLSILKRLYSPPGVEEGERGRKLLMSPTPSLPPPSSAPIPLSLSLHSLRSSTPPPSLQGVSSRARDDAAIGDGEVGGHDTLPWCLPAGPQIWRVFPCDTRSSEVEINASTASPQLMQAKETPPDTRGVTSGGDTSDQLTIRPQPLTQPPQAGAPRLATAFKQNTSSVSQKGPVVHRGAPVPGSVGCCWTRSFWLERPA